VRGKITRQYDGTRRKEDVIEYARGGCKAEQNCFVDSDDFSFFL
jgi:hypothetical protein